jgi:hypothetical protein
MDEEMNGIDPISGNEVPLGAKPEEVRDDVPIMASEGEYVLPANVVRYIGLDRIEKMVKQAKKGLTELGAEGRIGGEKATMDDDLPFSPEELMAVEEEAVADRPPGMAEGGMVTNNNDDIDPATGLPRWLVSLQKAPAPTTPTVAPVAPARSATSGVEPPKESWKDRQEGMSTKPTGLAASVNDWTVKDFNTYASARNSVGQKAGQALVGLTVPFGGVAGKIRERYLERNVPREMSSMIESGKDLQGNSLTSDQLDELRQNYSRITSEPLSRGRGVSGLASAALQESGLVKPRSPNTERVTRQQNRAQGDGLINRALDFITRDRTPSERKASSGPVSKRTSSESSRDRKDTPAKSSTPSDKSGSRSKDNKKK